MLSSTVASTGLFIQYVPIIFINKGLENLIIHTWISAFGILALKTDLWILNYVSTKATPYHEFYLPDGH